MKTFLATFPIKSVQNPNNSIFSHVPIDHWSTCEEAGRFTIKPKRNTQPPTRYPNKENQTINTQINVDKSKTSSIAIELKMSSRWISTNVTKERNSVLKCCFGRLDFTKNADNSIYNLLWCINTFYFFSCSSFLRSTKKAANF